MDTRPLVSVLIVNFNGGALVIRAVRAALASSVPVEVIIVDNASEDGSLVELRARVGADQRVRIVPSSVNVGFARANNVAIDLARGRYIQLLNPDCLVERDTLERVVAAMTEDASSGMAGCLLLNPDGTEQAGCRRAVPTPWRTMVRVLHLDKLFRRQPRFRSFVLRGTPMPEKPVAQEAISGAFMMVRREALEQVGGLDEHFFLHCEDLDWCMRFRQKGWRVLFVPDAKAVHHKGYCSKDRPVRVLWHLHSGMVRFYDKHFRRQYPAPLMWGVFATVWCRFSLLLIRLWVRKLREIIVPRPVVWVPEEPLQPQQPAIADVRDDDRNVFLYKAERRFRR